MQLIPVDADTYYSLRRHEPSDVFQRAVRFIYLNRTCYGGLYRENKAGHFNVPYGGGSRTPALLWDRDVLEIAHRVLASCDIDLRVCDFEATLEKAGAGDVVYCDPTYRGAGRDRFDRYGKVVFGWQDHVRVAAAACRARRRGALVFVSNSSCAEIRDLYPDGLEIRMFKSKSIGNRSKNPERQREVLIILDPERSERWRHLDWSHEVLSLRSSRVEKDTGHGVPKEDQSELAEKAARAA
jgi:DNA adenine methylase